MEALQREEEEEAAGGDGGDVAAAQQALAELAVQTVPLLQAMLDFLRLRSLEALVGAGGGGGDDDQQGMEAAGEVAVVVGPDAGPASAPEVQQGAAFPCYSSTQEQEGEAEALRAALAAAAFLPAGVAQQLGVAAGPASDDMPGLVAGGCAGWLGSLRRVAALRLGVLRSRLRRSGADPSARPGLCVSAVDPWPHASLRCGLQSRWTAPARQRWRRPRCCWRRRSRAACPPPRRPPAVRRMLLWRRWW